MKIDLNINGGFTLEVPDNMNDDAEDKLIQRIENEVNNALNKIALKYDMGITGIELQSE